jgi:hypothetical protein
MDECEPAVAAIAQANGGAINAPSVVLKVITTQLSPWANMAAGTTDTRGT